MLAGERFRLPVGGQERDLRRLRAALERCGAGVEAGEVRGRAGSGVSSGRRNCWLASGDSGNTLTPVGPNLSVRAWRSCAVNYFPFLQVSL